MRVRATNTQVNPVYWAHLRRWPYKVAVEYDVTEDEAIGIRADARLVVEDVAPAAEPEPERKRKAK